MYNRNKLNSADGITMVALVITIIILLILAGITLAFALGENGIISQAQRAKEQTELKEEEERNKIDETLAYINRYTTSSNSTNGGNAVSANSNYTTNEQIVGTWIDNKPIYRQVFTFDESVSSYGGIKYIKKTLINSGIDNIIDSGGYFNLYSSGVLRKMNFGQTESNWNKVPSFHGTAYVESNALIVNIQFNTDNYSSDSISGTIWIEYTRND